MAEPSTAVPALRRAVRGRPGPRADPGHRRAHGRDAAGRPRGGRGPGQRRPARRRTRPRRAVLGPGQGARTAARHEHQRAAPPRRRRRRAADRPAAGRGRRALGQPAVVACGQSRGWCTPGCRPTRRAAGGATCRTTRCCSPPSAGSPTTSRPWRTCRSRRWFPPSATYRARWAPPRSRRRSCGRGADGPGRCVTVSGLHAIAATQASMMMTAEDGTAILSAGKRAPGAPNYRSYRGSDGQWLYLAALTPGLLLPRTRGTRPDGHPGPRGRGRRVHEPAPPRRGRGRGRGAGGDVRRPPACRLAAAAGRRRDPGRARHDPRGMAGRRAGDRRRRPA